MLTILASVCYVIIAVAMTVLILLQRGAGAAAGSGFGGGASSTVFGAQGSANFMSRSTAVLAGLFFLLSLGMAIYHDKPGAQPGVTDNLGIMGRAATPAGSEPASTTGDVPQATPAAGPTPASAPETDAGSANATPAATAVPADASVPAPTAAAKDAKPETPKPASDSAKDSAKDSKKN